MSNRIVDENARTDGVTDRSYWDAGSSDQIEGFTTDFSVNAGQTVNFKINVNGTASSDLPYKVEIFRLGYYGGAGAREVAEFRNADGTVQAAPLFDESRGLVDAGNWTTTDHWDVPADAVSGVYIARVQRLDANGNAINGATNQIPFIVRNDGVAADIVLQTSDTTWQAYNGWAGNNGKVGPNFYGDPAGMVSHDPVPDPGLGAQNRAYAVSYNRPLLTREGGGAAAGAQDHLYGADYAAISWLEQNGYDTSYVSGQDTDRLGEDYLKNYKAFISVGHDEYWSGDQRAHVEAARDAGVNVLFWSGNEVYWKTRWDTAISADGTAYRTLVCYKETWANGDPNAGPEDYANIDPTNIWTGTWRDVRFLDSKDANGNYIAGGADPDPISGLRPTCHCGETTLTGQLVVGDGTGQFGGAIDVPTNYGSLRVWRNTAATNGEQDVSPGIIGYEWDMAPDDANRPAGLIKLSETTLDWGAILTDQGNKTVPGTGIHNLTLYRAESGALVFASGTVFWSWGLSNEHDSSPYGAAAENPIIKQFSVNLFADMGIQPGSLEAGLIAATASLDKTPAAAAINDMPATVAARSAVTITGTASDSDGNPNTPDGAVALVELSFDNGTTWKPATGTTNWSYSWRPLAQGNYTVLARAVDDSLNVWNATPTAEQVTVGAAVPPSTFSLFDALPPDGLSAASDSQPLETGMRFNVDQAGVVTQLRYFRDASDSTDTDVRDGHLWRVSDGALIGTATFNSAPGQSGWQFATFTSPIALQAGTDYIVSYQSADNYVATNNFFAPGRDETFDGVNDDAFSDPYGIISAPQDAVGAPNGVFRYGTALQMPTETYGASNYWVDITFDPNDGTANSPPVITSGDFTLPENKLAAGTVVASDPDGNPVTYAIAGGADADLFTINSASGALSFKRAPNFELPQDQGANNVYDVLVSATDGQSTPATRATTVTVTDVDETTPTASTLFDGAPTSFVSGTSDPTNYELGTKFASTQDGTITALRYYRGTADAGDTDVRTLRLWDAGNNVLGFITVTSTSGQSGWQVGTLSTPIAITAGQSYIVSYGYVPDNGDGAVESYAATGGYFNVAHTGPDGVLIAPASGAPSGSSSGGIGNGLYATTPGNVPSQSFNASNYWVDVLFQGGTAPTNQPPVFTSPFTFTAAENQTGVGLITATDPNGNALTYSITGGADAALFTIGATTGRLEFKNPRDYEAGQQSFNVTLGVSDGIAPPTTQALTVNLSDVDETADGPAALTGNVLKAEYIFGATPDTLFPGAGASQTATVGDGVEFAQLPTAGSAVGNGNAGLASVDARAQTVRVEFPLDGGGGSGSGFVPFSGASLGVPNNGVKLSDAGALPAIRSVRIIGQEGFTTSNGTPQALTDQDLTVTQDGIFLNMADKGRVIDIDPDTPGSQAAWVEFLVELNDAPTLAAPLADQGATPGNSFSYAVSPTAFQDADGDPISYTATRADGTALPGWLSFDAATRTFSGTPAAGDTGKISVLVTASDSYGGATTDSFDITVASAPDTAPPTASGSAPNITAAQQTQTVVVTYSDAGGSGVNPATIGTNDLTVSGPSAASVAGQTTAVDADGSITVTYTLASANGWESSDNGAYTVSVTAGAVADQAGNAIAAGQVASFIVNVTPAGPVPINGTQNDDTLPGTAGADTINGLGGNDTINGLAGDDILNGNEGKDKIDGGADEDRMAGGAGDDSYFVDNAGDVVIELPGEGKDEVNAYFSYALTDNVENLVLRSGSRINGTGNNLANALTGNSADNVLTGGGGGDTLTGAGGADTFVLDAPTGSSADTIKDFVAGTDFLAIRAPDYGITTGSGATAGGTLDAGWLVNGSGANAGHGQFLYNAGKLSWDRDGNGSASAVVVSTLSGSPTLQASSIKLLDLGAPPADTAPPSASGSAPNITAAQPTQSVAVTYADPGGSGINAATIGLDDLTVTGPSSATVTAFATATNADESVTATYTLSSANDWETSDNGSYTVSLVAGSVADKAGNGIAVGQVASFTVNVSGTGPNPAPINGTPDNDTLSGTNGSDTINGLAGNDNLNGLAGNDILNGGDGKDKLDGGAGADQLNGGTGDDAYFVDNAGDVVTELAGAGKDEVNAYLNYALTANVENLVLRSGSAIDGTGNDLNNTLTGNTAANRLDGQGGNDVLVGSGGADTLTGGAGNDTFKFTALTDSRPGTVDRIIDFTPGGDKIDLSAIDASSAASGDQAFIFIGGAAFSNQAGQLRIDSSVSGVRTVYGDIDGNEVADFELRVDTLVDLTATNFVL